eukprot:8036275-Ditylum_brightwellii.AAC.1
MLWFPTFHHSEVLFKCKDRIKTKTNNSQESNMVKYSKQSQMDTVDKLVYKWHNQYLEMNV